MFSKIWMCTGTWQWTKWPVTPNVLLFSEILQCNLLKKLSSFLVVCTCVWIKRHNKTLIWRAAGMESKNVQMFWIEGREIGSARQWHGCFLSIKRPMIDCDLLKWAAVISFKMLFKLNNSIFFLFCCFLCTGVLFGVLDYAWVFSSQCTTCLRRDGKGGGSNGSSFQWGFYSITMKKCR